MKIARARMYHPACLEQDESEIRELEQMIDLGDAIASPMIAPHPWATHGVTTVYKDGRCFKEYFVKEES